MAQPAWLGWAGAWRNRPVGLPRRSRGRWHCSGDHLSPSVPRELLIHTPTCPRHPSQIVADSVVLTFDGPCIRGTQGSTGCPNRCRAAAGSLSLTGRFTQKLLVAGRHGLRQPVLPLLNVNTTSPTDPLDPFFFSLSRSVQPSTGRRVSRCCITTAMFPELNCPTNGPDSKNGSPRELSSICGISPVLVLEWRHADSAKLCDAARRRPITGCPDASLSVKQHC